jgi:cytochrome P450 family 135
VSDVRAAAGLCAMLSAMRPAAEIPGPRLPRLAQSLLALSRPEEARLALRRRHGSVFRTRDAILGDVFHIADRDLVEEMFKWRPSDYEVGGPRRPMEPVTGPASILLLDGERHLRMRRLMLPPFHGEAIARFEGLIARITDREIDRWRPGAVVRTRAVAQTITMEAIIEAVFGITDPGRVAELRRLLPRLSSVNPLLAIEATRRDLGPRSPWGRFVRARERVDRMLFEEMARRRGEAGGESILALLLAARDEDGRPLSDGEVRDELVTLLLAGHETTATSIAWAFERLLRTPAALAHARSGDGGYVDAVVRETLRLRPVVPEVFRAPTRPVELGGWRFEAGARLAASIFLVQRDPALYPDPGAFRPERFLDGAPEPYAWIPFGGGVRRCLGAAFAQLEMRIVLGRILARTQLRAPRPAGERARFQGVTTVPARGGEALVERVAA